MGGRNLCISCFNCNLLEPSFESESEGKKIMILLWHWSGNANTQGKMENANFVSFDESSQTNEWIKRRVQGITQKMLIQTLRELVTDRIITRTIYQQVPPRVEYSVTELGQSLEPALRLLCQWGQNYVEETFAKGEVQILNLNKN